MDNNDFHIDNFEIDYALKNLYDRGYQIVENARMFRNTKIYDGGTAHKIS